MSTPYIIQPGDVLYGYNGADANQGPFEHAGNIYVTLVVFDAVSQVPLRTSVFKSTDAGASFTEMDSANAPASPPAEYTSCCFYPSSGGNVLYFMAEQGSDKFSNPMAIFSFDMATDTWTTIATGGPTANCSPQQLMVRTSDGKFVFFYNLVGGTTYTVYGVVWDAGWGSPATLGTYTGSAAFVNLIGISNADKAVCVWTSDGDSEFYVNTWTSGGGFSSKSIAFPFATPWDPSRYDLGQGWNAQGKFISAENKIGWCLPFYPTPSTIQPTMLIADMSTSPPTFTTASIASDINADEDTFWTDFCISPDGSVLTAMWTWQGTGAGNTPNQILQSTSPALAGTWAAKSVYWDNATDPPVTPPSQEGGIDGPNIPNSICLRQLTTGVRAMIGLFPIQASQPVYQGQYFLSIPASTPTLQLSKTVVGGSAVATDFIVTATGPDTISGAGGVGPASVTAGTYNLSETGPAQYVGVWNCGSATMPTSTSVVVPDSSTAVVCSLTNTFTPTPPPPPTPTDAVLRYQIPQRRWFPHNYHDHIIEHYLDEANVDQPNDMQLLMLAGTHILKSGGNTDNGTDITTLVYLPSNDGGDQRAQKLYVDTMLEADQTGQVISQVRFNNQQQLGPSVAMNPTGLREQFLENISSLADLRLYRNIMAVLSWTGGPDGPRIYAFEPSGFAQPYVSTFFVTQYINLAYPGWKHARRYYPAYISNSPILLTIETQDNRTYGPYTLPSTGGQFRIIPMILNHGVKDLAFAFQLDGQGHPFALFPGEFVVEVKGWADPDYIDLAIFRT